MKQALNRRKPLMRYRPIDWGSKDQVRAEAKARRD